ncbi:MAG: hypothetical protein Q9226_004796 [Calogaya cf. arnoldii]
MSSFSSRLIIWLWLAVLTVYMIITASIADDPESIILSQKYAMDTVFGLVLSAVAGLSFGMWVIDGGDSSPTTRENKIPMNNLGSNNLTKLKTILDRLIADISSRKNKNRNRHSEIHICAALPLALIVGYIHIIAISTDAKLFDVLLNYPMLRFLASLCCVIQTLNYVSTSPAVKSYIGNFRHKFQEEMQIINQTTPLLSGADDAVLKVTPKTLFLVKQLAALPVYLLACYIIADVFSKGDLVFLENELLLHSVLAPCLFYGMLTSSSFKSVVDGVYQKAKAMMGGYAKKAPSTAHTEKEEKKPTVADASSLTDHHATAAPMTRETYEKAVSDASTMTNRQTQTAPPTIKGKKVAHAPTMTDSTQAIRPAAHICARCQPDLEFDDKRAMHAFRPTLGNGLQDMGAEAFDEMLGFSPVDSLFPDVGAQEEFDFFEEIL